MRKVITKFLPIMLVCLMVTSFIPTAYAAPDDNNQSNYEDYINDFVDGVSSALNDFENNNINYYLDNDDSTNSTDRNIATEPVTNATEPHIPPLYDEEDTEYQDFDTIYEQETVPYEEPTYQEATVMVEADENENYDYSYTPPTEEPTEEYQPEILTETYTDPPFLERFAITDGEKGNLFIALGLWASIIIGIIIVLSVVIATHRRKKGN